MYCWGVSGLKPCVYFIRHLVGLVGFVLDAVSLAPDLFVRSCHTPIVIVMLQHKLIWNQARMQLGWTIPQLVEI